MSLHAKAALLSLVLSVLLLGSLGSEAQGRDRYTDVRDLNGQPEFRTIKRFGNRNRLAKRVDPRIGATDQRRFYQREVVSGRSQIVGLKKFGNKKRIAKLVDPAGSIRSGKVVVIGDPQGRSNFVAIRRFGNARKIARKTGQSR